MNCKWRKKNWFLRKNMQHWSLLGSFISRQRCMGQNCLWTVASKLLWYSREVIENKEEGECFRFAFLVDKNLVDWPAPGECAKIEVACWNWQYYSDFYQRHSRWKPFFKNRDCIRRRRTKQELFSKDTLKSRVWS